MRAGERATTTLRPGRPGEPRPGGGLEGGASPARPVAGAPPPEAPRGEAPPGSERVLVLFLRALMAARRSLALYPPASEMAAGWVHRLHASLEGFFEQGLCFPVRVESDRFVWAGPDVVTDEPTLETFRFDLEARGVRGIEIDPAVRDWELQKFLELLNTPGEELGQLGGAAAFLAGYGVSHVRVTAPGDAQPEVLDSDEATRHALQTGRDPVDLFVDTLLELTEARLADLGYDRAGLAAWLADVAGGDPAHLYRLLLMLHDAAERTSDREVRTRTLVEALLALPEPLLRGVFTEHLIPRAGQDVLALNLLSQFTETELRRVAQLVPREALLTLGSELLEFPWEESKRRRLIESITVAVQVDQEPEARPAREAVPADDPVLVELREEILAACAPEVLLDRSADILLALLFQPDSDEFTSSTLDAIEEIVGEALARTRLDIAVRVLATLGSSVHVGGVNARERARHLALLQQRLAGRTHVALVAGALRQPSTDQQLAAVAEYLALLPRDAIQEFTAMLADEGDRQMRARMCQVLAKIGPPAVPVLLQWLEDRRWYVVRNAVHVLGKIGGGAVGPSLVTLLGHGHPRVRIETMRVLAALSPEETLPHLVGMVEDPDPAVRLETLRALGALRSDLAVLPLQALATGRNGVTDPETRREAIEALAAIQTEAARSALAAMARRRLWPWQRMERQLRAAAAAALRKPVTAADPDDE